MPPGPAYNWLCVACSAADIISRAARIRASQLAPRSSPVTAKKRKESPGGRLQNSLQDNKADASSISSNSLDAANVYPIRRTTDAGVERHALPEELQMSPSLTFASTKSTATVQNVENLTLKGPVSSPERPLEALEALERSTLGGIHPDEVLFVINLIPGSSTNTQTSVPISIYSRAASVLHAYAKSTIVQSTLITYREAISLWRHEDSPLVARCHYWLMNSKIGLAASLGYGAASEIIRRTGSGNNDQQSSAMMTEANITRLVSKLSQMRGAALKLGQFFSIQGKLKAI